MLGTETDELEEQNNEIKSQIDKMIERANLSDKDKERIKQEMEEEAERLTRQIEES